MTKRKALGRGLSSLIPEVPTVGAAGVRLLEIGLIHPDKAQPRQSFDDTSLKGLAESIKTHGILQPVVVTEEEEGFRLVIGERRWRAAIKAGLQKIPAVVRKVDEQRRVEVALVENLQRQNLNPMEEARACKRLADQFHSSHEEIAGHLGKSRSYVSNLLRLLDLDAEVQKWLEAGKLTLGHGRVLAGLPTHQRQRRLGDLMIRRHLSVRQAEKLAGRAREGREGGSVKSQDGDRNGRSADPNVRAAEDRLKLALGTTIRIIGGAERGRIELQYSSASELQRLYEMLLQVRAAPPPAAGSRLTLPGRTVLAGETA
ncbi:MAG: ParB/RepB/Spo0J family partition protein [Acidobacteriota bacterium]